VNCLLMGKIDRGGRIRVKNWVKPAHSIHTLLSLHTHPYFFFNFPSSAHSQKKNLGRKIIGVAFAPICLSPNLHLCLEDEMDTLFRNVGHQLPIHAPQQPERKKTKAISPFPHVSVPTLKAVYRAPAMLFTCMHPFNTSRSLV